MPINKKPPIILISLEWVASHLVIVRCNTPEISDKAKSGKPNPSPNQRKTFNLLKASTEVNEIAKMPTTRGPEQGRAIGPYNSP
jgi:hypothetical protein